MSAASTRADQPPPPRPEKRVPRPKASASTTESREQRKERWIEWTARAWQHCPLNLYDEHQKLGEIAVGEMLAEIERLTTRGGIARSLMTVRQAERFHERCKELGV